MISISPSFKQSKKKALRGGGTCRRDAGNFLRGVTFCAHVRACVPPPPLSPPRGQSVWAGTDHRRGRAVCSARQERGAAAAPAASAPAAADVPAAAVHRRVRARAERVRCGVKRGCGGRGATLRLRTARGRKAGA